MSSIWIGFLVASQLCAAGMLWLRNVGRLDAARTVGLAGCICFVGFTMSAGSTLNG